LLFWFLLLVALGVAGTLTGLRVLQPEAPWGATAVAFAPLAVPAYTLVLLLVLWQVVRGRRRWVVVLLLPLAGLGVHGWWLAPLWTGANPPAPPQAEQMTVMTAGLDAGSADGLEVVRLASEHEVDLLALQDVTPRLLEQMDSAGLRDLFPHRAGTPAEGSDGTLLLSRTPVSGAASLPTGHGSVDAEVEVGDESLRVVAVRVRALDDADGWRADHEVLLSTARDGADLVLGDLNATGDHEELEALADARRIAG
jgi:endonuclease/exonuclease/phosphatase (EEP) superfamily protein YafD